jgi:hypothetical protein
MYLSLSFFFLVDQGFALAKQALYQFILFGYLEDEPL